MNKQTQKIKDKIAVLQASIEPWLLQRAGLEGQLKYIEGKTRGLQMQMQNLYDQICVLERECLQIRTREREDPNEC